MLSYKLVLLYLQCDCNLLLAGGEYVCCHCGRYSYRVCACSVTSCSVKYYTATYSFTLDALFVLLLMTAVVCEMLLHYYFTRYYA